MRVHVRSSDDVATFTSPRPATVVVSVVVIAGHVRVQQQERKHDHALGTADQLHDDADDGRRRETGRHLGRTGTGARGEPQRPPSPPSPPPPSTPVRKRRVTRNSAQTHTRPK